MSRTSAGLLALVACQPYRPTLGAPCLTAAPATTQVGPVACAAAIAPSGEGRTVDTLLASPDFRAVIRAPGASLTLPGVGGGTIVDLAPWGHPDVIHEIVATIGGGALVPDLFEVDGDGVIVAGPLVRLPGGPAVTAGARGSLRWRAEDGWLVADGADGLRLHLRGDVALRDGRFWVGAAVVVPGGPVVDLGGVVEIDGDRVRVAAGEHVLSWWSGPNQPAAGDTDGVATAWRRGEELVARWPVTGAFSTAVPADWTAVRAEAPGLAPGPWTPIGDALDLKTGAGGALGLTTDASVVVRFDGDTDASPVRLGRAGAEVPLGTGLWRMTAEGGPDWVTETFEVTVTAEETAAVDVSLAPRFDPGRAVLVAAPWPTDRDRSWRGSAHTALIDAAAAGADYVVLAPQDEVGGATDADDSGGPRWENGAWSTDDQTGAIVAWPWDANAKLAGHGALPRAALSPLDALAAAWGGPGTDRYTAVDLAWLAAVDATPARVRPRPDLVLLGDPGDDPATAWRAWWRWLDAAVPLVPLGPFAWAPVDDPSAFGAVEVERSLVEGRWSATTGPRLDLRVGSAGPGQISSAGDVRVATAGALDQYWLIGEGGRVLDHWRAGESGAKDRRARPAGAWVVAVATGPDGAWAATAPVWLTLRP